MNEVKIQIPDNCELIKDGDTYVVREKKQEPPRSWEEFCNRYPVKPEECYFGRRGEIYKAEEIFVDYRRFDSNWCVSMEEAEAFLALMQLRQLRKAWVGDWEPTCETKVFSWIETSHVRYETYVNYGTQEGSRVLSFPTKGIAEDFHNCFKDLCETAKILL